MEIYKKEPWADLASVMGDKEFNMATINYWESFFFPEHRHKNAKNNRETKKPKKKKRQPHYRTTNKSRKQNFTS